MNLKISMCFRVVPWDNNLVNQKEGQMKSITIIESDQFGYDRTFTIRHREDGDDVFLAEVDPDFGLESLLGSYASEAAAIDRINVLVGK